MGRGRWFTRNKLAQVVGPWGFSKLCLILGKKSAPKGVTVGWLQQSRRSGEEDEVYSEGLEQRKCPIGNSTAW